MLNDDVMLGVIISFSPTSGRMRYAPTPVRLLSWPNTINHYPRSIVFLVVVGLRFGFVFAHVRAYAIRPYTGWFIVVAKYN